MTGRGVVRTFRDLVVWQRAFELVVAVYRASEALPVQERYGLTAELRKTARSIAYNIAEGHRRTSTTEYMRFLDIVDRMLGALLRKLRNRGSRTPRLPSPTLP
jgi:four helix bundle protein